MPGNIAFRKPAINGWVIVVTLGVIGLSQLNYDWLASIQYGLLVFGTLLIGIPHGATDDHIFYKTGLADRFSTSNITFYAGYVVIAGLYAGLWLIWPSGALLLFLIISIYHFGQSQLFYLSTTSFKRFKLPFYLFWGSYVLGLPLMFSYTEALPIIQELIGYRPLTPNTVADLALPLGVGLFAVNAGFLSIAKYRRMLSKSHLYQEVLNLVLLGLLAYTTPLFVAFITYWALWHSFNSMIEITTFLTKQARFLDVKAFYKRAFPLSVITFAGIGLIFWLTASFGSRESMLAVFFIIIAAVTLPHSILMDVLYAQKQGSPN